MRILIVHNQLWAHYKSKLFSEIYREMKAGNPKDELLVAQIALYEASRKAMQTDDSIRYEYPYQVLFERSLDQVGFGERRRALFRIFNEYKPTVLNITGYFDWAQVLLMLYARSKGVKVVISSESSSADHNRSPLKEAIKKWIVAGAHAFFCFGKTSAEYLESLGVKPTDITVRNAAVIDEDVIRNAYERAREEYPSNGGDATHSRKFVYVGRLAPEKNLEMLVRAFAKTVQGAGPHAGWQLLFVGDGPDRAILENLVSELGMNNSVIFAGGHPWFKVPEWLAQSDVLVLPSKSEPWGLVVNEAMVCGMPVIVSQTCGCAPDLVQNDRNGFTFDPQNQTELEAHLHFFIKNTDFIPVMGQESVKLIAPFAATPVASRMVQTYRNLTAHLKGA